MGPRPEALAGEVEGGGVLRDETGATRRGRRPCPSIRSGKRGSDDGPATPRSSSRFGSALELVLVVRGGLPCRRPPKDSLSIRHNLRRRRHSRRSSLWGTPPSRIRLGASSAKKEPQFGLRLIGKVHIWNEKRLKRSMFSHLHYLSHTTTPLGSRVSVSTSMHRGNLAR